MGLCKCAKKKVTNLFCFEHHVNVCEYCLVSDHERVIFIIYNLVPLFFLLKRIHFQVYCSILCTMAPRQ